MLTLTSKDIVHGLRSEKYVDQCGNPVSIEVSMNYRNETYFQVIDRNENRSGIFYERNSAMQVAAALAISPKSSMREFA